MDVAGLGKILAYKKRQAMKNGTWKPDPKLVKFAKRQKMLKRMRKMKGTHRALIRQAKKRMEKLKQSKSGINFYNHSLLY